MFNFGFHPVEFMIETLQRCRCSLKSLSGGGVSLVMAESFFFLWSVV
jgi:hypothetical protein